MTTLTLSPTIAALAENTAIAKRIKVADIVIADGTLGSNTLSLSGDSASAFEIDGNALYLRAGTRLNYEGKPTLAVTVNLTDSSSPNAPALAQSYALSITDINEAPSLALNNPLANLSENASTVARIKVADIAVRDDRLGTNVLALSGNDASAFEIDGNALYLRAGTRLDTETKSSFSVNVMVSDPSLPGSKPSTKAYVLSIADYNEAPSALALNNTVSSLAENVGTSARIKVADIAITDDATGSNTLSLSGANAAAFEIVGNALYLRAGVRLDHERAPNLAVTVNLTDPSLPGSPVLTQDYRLNVGDINEAPRSLELRNAVTSLAENISTSARIKVADLVTRDDRLGTNVLSLSGDDAGAFEIIGKALYLRAGTALDYEKKHNYSVNVTVSDPSIPGSGPQTKAYVLSIADANEAPTALALNNAVASLDEDAGGNARIKIADIAITDDALGNNTLSLSGNDAGAFEVDGNALYLRAGTRLDHEGTPNLAVTVSLTDPSLPGTATLTQSHELSINDVNEAPSALALTNTVTTLAEDTGTGTRIKIADIAITDDALGDNRLSLSGENASAFEIDGNALYLRAGTRLDYETKPKLAVTVGVSDPSLPNAAALTQSHVLSIIDVNEGPSIVLVDKLNALNENADTSQRTRLASISIVDDPLHSAILSLGGADAKAFEIVDNALYLRAGVPLNHENKNSYQVSIDIRDPRQPAATAFSQSFALSINDVNEAPGAIQFFSEVLSLDENTAVSQRIKLGSLQVAGGGLGNNTVSLYGGARDAFEIDGDAVYLRAGRSFDYEKVSQLKTNVIVRDISRPNVVSQSIPIALLVNDLNEAPSQIRFSTNSVTLPENTDTRERIKLADFSDGGDALGNHIRGFSSGQLDKFEIVGNSLYLRAGTTLDYETNSSYTVVVSVRDTTLPESPPVGGKFTLIVGDVNENPAPPPPQPTPAGNRAPTAIKLNDEALHGIYELGQKGSIPNRIELAKLKAIDDGLGTNVFSLSGPDAANFEIQNGRLYLKAGSTLDAATKPQYLVTIQATDAELQTGTSLDYRLDVAALDKVAIRNTVIDRMRQDDMLDSYVGGNWTNGKFKHWVQYLVGDLAPEAYHALGEEKLGYGYFNDTYGLAPSQEINWAPSVQGFHYLGNGTYLGTLSAAYNATRDPRYLERYFTILEDMALNERREVSALGEEEMKARSLTIADGSVDGVPIMLHSTNTALAGFFKNLDNPIGAPAVNWHDDRFKPNLAPLAPDQYNQIDADSLYNIMEGVLRQYLSEVVLNHSRPLRPPNQRAVGLAASVMMTNFFKDVPEAKAWQEMIGVGVLDLLQGSSYPDGGFVEASINYNNVAIDGYKKILHYTEPGSLLHDELSKLIDEFALMMAALRTPFGTTPQIGNSIFGTTPVLRDAPEFAEHSMLFPYSGYAVQRNGWDSDDAYLFLYNMRQIRGHGMAGGNSIQMASHGKLLLAAGGPPNYGNSNTDDVPNAPSHTSESSTWKTNTIVVDGKSQFFGQSGLNDVNVIKPARWLTSNEIDYAEANWELGYQDRAQPIIDLSVTHQRKVIFLRDEGAWIIVDKMDAQEAQHQYTQIWKFAPFVQVNNVQTEGFNKEQVTVDGAEDRITAADGLSNASVNLSIRQFGADLDYEKHWGGDLGTYGYYNNGRQFIPTVDVHTKFQGSSVTGSIGDSVVISVLRPFVGASGISDGLETIDLSDNGIAGASITFESGRTVQVMASTMLTDLSLGGHKVTLSDLLLVDTDADGSQRMLVTGNRTESGANYLVSDGNTTPLLVPTGFEWITDPNGALRTSVVPA